MATKMLDELHNRSQYKEDINSEHVQRLSMFTVFDSTQQNPIYSLCPVDECHAWLSILEYMGLVLVNKDGAITEKVDLDFNPFQISIVGTTEILMTRFPASTSVYKLSLHNKQVTTFVDIKQHYTVDISINERGEVFLSTDTSEIVVLNLSGMIMRKFTIGSGNIPYLACLSLEYLCVMEYPRDNWADPKIFTVDSSSNIIQTWSGELDNGEQVGSMYLRKMSSDKYDRLFVPDCLNHQVYVLTKDGTKATCLLDQKHGVINPRVVGVDTTGNVWIGCGDGTVHVMGL